MGCQKGGKGGSRKVSQNDGTEYWTTEGETITFDGKSYQGGRKGADRTTLPSLPEARFVAYGGNGAGAAVGLDAAYNSRMNGGDAPSPSISIISR